MRIRALVFTVLMASSLLGQTTTSRPSSRPASERHATEVTLEECREEILQLLADKRGNTDFDANIADILQFLEERLRQNNPTGWQLSGLKDGYHALLVVLSQLRNNWTPDQPPDLRQRYAFAESLYRALGDSPSDVGKAFYKRLFTSDVFRNSPSVFRDDILAIIDAREAQQKPLEYQFLVIYNSPGFAKPESDAFEARIRYEIGIKCLGLSLYERALFNFQKAGPENMGLMRVIDTYIAMKNWEAAGAACDRLEADLPRWIAIAASYGNRSFGFRVPIQRQTRESLEKALAERRSTIATLGTRPATSPAN
jgi:hypothetical protein